jgi:hypothetical protein
MLQEEVLDMPDNTTTADSMSHEYGKHHCGIKKRPWSWAEIAIVVGGFIVFWPLGLVALGLKLFKGELWRGSSEIAAPWKDKSAQDMASKWGGPWQAKWQPSSGNAAFDDYRKAQLERLEEERRKLWEEQKAFGEYLAKLRRAKDQDEFDRFMAERNPKPATE